MTICPIAIAVGCKKCPVFKLCPVKGLLGDMPKKAEPAQVVELKTKGKATKAAVAKPAQKPRATATAAKPKRAKKSA